MRPLPLSRGGILALGLALGAGPGAPLAAQQFADVEAAVQQAIQDQVFPGAVVVIGRRDTVLFAKGFGHFTWAPTSPVPSPDSTLWDLASLTKVVATASIAMALVDRGQLDLDAPVANHLPRFVGEDRERVTVRMLLNHTSGLPAFAPLYQDAETREQAVEHLWQVPLRRPPGQSPDYSDLNAILLGLVVERITGVALDQLARQEVFDPLGMEQTLYAPGASLRPRIVPSMSDDQGPLAGRPSDPNAFALGGVAGHAGVFGTGADLARFAQAWLREGLLSEGRRWVLALTLRQFLQRSPSASTRALGWDTPVRDPFLKTTTSFGSMASPSTYGHTGWSGTSLWIDPAGDLFVVLLTNRSFDPKVRRSLIAIRDVRHSVADAARTSVLALCASATTVRC